MKNNLLKDFCLEVQVSQSKKKQKPGHKEKGKRLGEISQSMKGNNNSINYSKKLHKNPKIPPTDPMGVSMGQHQDYRLDF